MKFFLVGCVNESNYPGFTIQIMAFYTYMEELPLTSGPWSADRMVVDETDVWSWIWSQRLVLGLVLKGSSKPRCSTIPRMKVKNRCLIQIIPIQSEYSDCFNPRSCYNDSAAASQ